MDGSQYVSTGVDFMTTVTFVSMSGAARIVEDTMVIAKANSTFFSALIFIKLSIKCLFSYGDITIIDIKL